MNRRDIIVGSAACALVPTSGFSSSISRTYDPVDLLSYEDRLELVSYYIKKF